jgi:tRNA threonylcarbamoyladenosine biosynthesis protein TsaE
MDEKVIIFDEQEVPAVAHQLMSLMPTCKVFAFTGPLGAGKTTLIAQMLAACGVTQPVTSPTFTYVNLYENNIGQLFYHFDLYRIEKLDDFVTAGFDEYLYAANSWTLVEWPQIIMPLLKKQVCFVELDYSDHKRKIIIKEVA